MMESEAYQNLIDRLERIEKYVVRATGYAEHEHLRTSLRVQRYDNPPKLH